MIVTMYKGCILTANYQEVFDTKIREGNTTSVFEDYLETLDNKSFNINGYVTDSGSFNIAYDLDGMNAFECNYVRFMSDMEGEITVYAFVDSVIRSNNCITVNYTVDVFHTYFPVCSLRDSLISNFRKKVKDEHAELPIKYISNLPFYIQRILSTPNSLNQGYYLVARVQKYRTVSGGGASLRDTRYLLFGKITASESALAQNTKMSINEIIEIIKTLESFQGFAVVLGWDNQLVENAFNYDIDDYLIINDNFNMEDLFSVSDVVYGNNKLFSFGLMLGNPNDGSIETSFCALNEIKGFEKKIIPLNANSIYTEYQPEGSRLKIKANPRIYGFGFYSNIIPLEFNNLDYEVFFTHTGGNNEFHINVEFDNKIIEITDVFKFMLPFTGLNAEQLSQREIAKKVGTIKGITSIVSGIAEIGVSAVGFNAASRVYAKAYKTGRLSPRAHMLRREEAQDAGGIIGGVSSIINGITDVSAANARKYQSSYGVNCNSEIIGNVTGGLCLFFITSQNGAEVNSAINEVGYSVFYRTNDLEYGQDTTDWDYNTIVFSNAKVVGSCPQDILQQIKYILENGVKVWYTKNVS